jgi:uncharacterized protein (DUF1330 family)
VTPANKFSGSIAVARIVVRAAHAEDASRACQPTRTWFDAIPEGFHVAPPGLEKSARRVATDYRPHPGGLSRSSCGPRIGLDSVCLPWIYEVETAAKPDANIGQYERMTAYWISTYPEVIDEAKLAAYAKLAGPALEACGGTYLARGLPELVYEGGQKTRVVVIAFASVDAARDAHDSAAYQQALAALDGGAVRDLRIVPGV